MKQSDVFTIILVTTVGMMAAFFISNAILEDPDLKSVSFKVVDPISGSLEQPDPELFNSEAINPTVEVEIGTCEDSNGNGILDPDERKKCLGVDELEEETEDEETEGDEKTESEREDEGETVETGEEGTEEDGATN